MFSRLIIASSLFILVLFVHANSKVIVATDSMWSIYLAQSLVNDGDLILDEYKALAKERKNYGLRKRKGQLYSYFPVGTAIMASPFVWAYSQTLPKIAELLPGFPRGKSADELSVENMNLPLQRVIASSFVAATVVIIFFLSCQFISIYPAAFVALLAAFCSPLWSTASRGLWQHGPSALLISAALLLLSRVKYQPILAGFSGAILAFAYVVRPTNAIAFICFGLYVLFSSRESFRIYCLSAALILVPFVAFSYDFLARFLPPYYYANRLHLGFHVPQALAANLFSPNRGIFFLSPVLLPALLPMYETLKSFKIFSFSFAVLAAFCGHLLAISLFPEWWGGHAFGPRYMTETIPYVTYFFALWLNHFKLNKKSAIILSLSIVLSFLMHFEGATNFKTFLWNVNPINIDRQPSRVWDLSDMQFLR